MTAMVANGLVTADIKPGYGDTTEEVLQTVEAIIEALIRNL